MASVINVKWNIMSLQFYLWIILLGLSQCQKAPRLEILPLQAVQRKPVGKSLLLTCRPEVPDISLVTDLKWRDNSNLNVLPKVAGQTAPAMYTEFLPGNQALALIIPYLSESMAGMYYCSASYANTELLEAGVKIETYVAITWKDAPESQFPILGSDYNVRCEVTASPPPTVDWLRNGDPIKSSGRYVVETRGLLIKNVEESDDGIYTCRAAVIQTGELVERNIRVEVQIKPDVKQLPSEVEAVEGQEYSMICNATGKPPPEFTWTKLQTQQNVAMADRFLVNAQTGQMSITRVEEQDHGPFVCRAQNAAGFSESQTFLRVLVRPKIYEFNNITVGVDTDGIFNCRATGRPAPQITFRRWGSREELTPGFQANDDRLILEQTTDEERGESTGTLRISKVLRTDDGLYECVARNKGETAYKVGHITVEFPPDFEHMKQLPPVYSWEERIANLSCLAQGIPNATIEWRWRDKLIKDWYDTNFEIQGTGPRSDLLVRPVDRQYYSAYKCIATNRLGRAEHMMELREAKVPDVVPQAKPTVVTATTMTFEIIGPPTELGLPITAYSVQYKEERNPDWAMAFNRSWSPDSPYIVEGLRPQTSYQFRFAARNQVGIGQFGAYRIQSTPTRSVPEAPKLLHQPIQPASPEEGEDAIVISPYADHFELRWNVPADNGEPIDTYQIRYCPGFKMNGEWNEIDGTCVVSNVHSTESTHLEMRDLKADTYYRIELKAHNAIGYSAPASLQMKTARGLDDMISFVESAALSSAAIVGIAVAGVIIILILVDLLCCVTVNAGVFATLCRKTKRSPSDLDEETKLGSGSLIKERPPSPSPLPPPVRLGPSTPSDDEKQPLNMPINGAIKQNSSVEFDGRVVHSRSGDIIIGKNSAV